MAVYSEIKGTREESGIDMNPASWRDKEGKSFLFDAQGNPRLVQFRWEHRGNDGSVMFAVETRFPEKYMEGRSPASQRLEAGPSVMVSVPGWYLGKDGTNASRFRLLDDMEGFYKKDLEGERQGIALLAKEFVENRMSFRKPGEIAVYFQDKMQAFINTLVEEKKKQVSRRQDGFQKLAGKEKFMVVKAQDWARENRILNAKGYTPSFNSRACDPVKEYGRFMDEVMALGFVPPEREKNPLRLPARHQAGMEPVGR